MTPWFVVNPHAGGVRSDEIVKTLRRRLAGREAVISSELPDASVKGPLLVIAVGGDGTISRVLNHCDPRRLRLGIIPRGSANDLAAELRIPADLHAAFDVIEAGRCEAIDLVSVNGSRFATCGGIGLAGQVALRANRWKSQQGALGRVARRLGPLVYLLATLALTLGRSEPGIGATLRVGRTARRIRLSTALASNQPRVGGFFTASPEASNRDGILHLCVLQATPSRARLLWLCAQLLRGRPAACPEIFELRARSLTLETDADVTFFGDGEALAHGRRFRIEVLPGALTVLTRRARMALAEEAA
jgi:diacylglycerol kinase (ATP)